MRVLKNIGAFFYRKKLANNSSSKKSFDEIYNDSGVFEYTADGFKILYQDFEKELKWSEITELGAYKADLITYDQIEMRIVYGEMSFTISEELPGWYQFVRKTKDIFQTIPKDWNVKIVFPPFETNYTVLYKKSID